MKALKLYPAAADFSQQFMKEKHRLEKVLGSGVQIEHVGSTAVPGLGGKGIIDILIGTVGGTSLTEIADKLVSAGYFPDLDNDIGNERIFLASREHDSTLGDYHLHVVHQGSAQWAEFVVFRDGLRADSMLRDEYDSLKQRLLQETHGDRRQYKQQKSAFIQHVLEQSM